MKNSLKEFASAKFIRFLPTKYNKFKVLRVEAYGILLTKGIYLFSFCTSDTEWSHNKQILGKLRQDRAIYIYEGVVIDEYQK